MIPMLIDTPQSTLKESIAAAEQIAPLLTPSTSNPTITNVAEPRHARLANLVFLLKSANMEALNAFVQFKSNLANTLQEDCQFLELTINCLDFEAARMRCDEILKRLETEPYAKNQ